MATCQIPYPPMLQSHDARLVRGYPAYIKQEVVLKPKDSGTIPAIWLGTAVKGGIFCRSSAVSDMSQRMFPCTYTRRNRR